MNSADFFRGEENQSCSENDKMELNLKFNLTYKCTFYTSVNSIIGLLNNTEYLFLSLSIF